MTENEALTLLKGSTIQSGGGSSDFDLNPDIAPPSSAKLRPAGVLVAIDLAAPSPSVILTKRASSLKHHPGQIAFAGGKVDVVDGGSVINAALREAQEEIGLPTGLVDVIGTLPSHQTVTNFAAVPVVGVIREKFQMRPETGEVDEVFHVPLSHFVDPDNFRVEWRIWGGIRRNFFVVPYGPYYIWGATARMLRVLSDRMNQA